MFRLSPNWEDSLPMLHLDWDPRDHPDVVQECISLAQRDGVIEPNRKWELAYEFRPDGDGDGYRWMLHSRNPRDGLVLSSRIHDQVWLGDQLQGKVAFCRILDEGIREANALLQELATMRRSSTAIRSALMFIAGGHVGLAVALIMQAWLGTN